LPHIIVKAFPGRTDEQKARLAEAVARSVIDIFGSSDSSISVAFEDVPQERWKEAVYDKDIAGGGVQLVKAPGYTM
jgi:4-oxalocrotonate tautomerase